MNDWFVQSKESVEYIISSTKPTTGKTPTHTLSLLGLTANVFKWQRRRLLRKFRGAMTNNWTRTIEVKRKWTKTHCLLWCIFYIAYYTLWIQFRIYSIPLCFMNESQVEGGDLLSSVTDWVSLCPPPPPHQLFPPAGHSVEVLSNKLYFRMWVYYVFFATPRELELRLKWVSEMSVSSLVTLACCC